ncbi:Uncharacterised protein [Mycobacteroides abscessus subsp. abscessus]|nr:Uncharacterised protein [Mycobacteroides abscessus subsp. abscessus]
MDFNVSIATLIEEGSDAAGQGCRRHRRKPWIGAGNGAGIRGARRRCGDRQPQDRLVSRTGCPGGGRARPPGASGCVQRQLLGAVRPPGGHRVPRVRQGGCVGEQRGTLAAVPQSGSGVGSVVRQGHRCEPQGPVSVVGLDRHEDGRGSWRLDHQHQFDRGGTARCDGAALRGGQGGAERTDPRAVAHVRADGAHQYDSVRAL